jgi:hypothetical protein
MGYVIDRDYVISGDVITEWHPEPSGQTPWFDVAPTPEDINPYYKPWAAHVLRQRIDEQQELRSISVVGFRMPQQGFAIMEESYAKVLVPAATNALTEATTPLWWGLKRLRDNRNQLLAALEGAVECPSITAQQILNFDVSRGPATLTFCGTDYPWDGWAYPLP